MWNRVQIPRPSIQATRTSNPVSCLRASKTFSDVGWRISTTSVSFRSTCFHPQSAQFLGVTAQLANQYNTVRAPWPFRHWVELGTYLVSLYTAHSSLPSLRPRRGSSIYLAPTHSILARPHDRLRSRVLKFRTRHHTAHNPRAPRHMCRHSTCGADFDCSSSRPRAAPHRRARDDVFCCAGGGGGFWFAGFGGAVDLCARVSVCVQGRRG
jgi:hypothetical protein